MLSRSARTVLLLAIAVALARTASGDGFQTRELAATGVAPSKVFVYDARVGESDCTCRAWNVGFLFAPDGIDVPHDYVVSDEEAARRQAEVDAIE